MPSLWFTVYYEEKPGQEVKARGTWREEVNEAECCGSM